MCLAWPPRVRAISPSLTPVPRRFRLLHPSRCAPGDVDVHGLAAQGHRRYTATVRASERHPPHILPPAVLTCARARSGLETA